MKPIEAIIRSAEQNPSSPAQAACQGVAGAFSHRACLEVFDQPDIQFYPQFEDVFRAVSLGERRYGIIPIENTLAGSVTDNYDLMLQYRLYIVGTVKVKIEHSLLVLPAAAARNVSRTMFQYHLVSLLGAVLAGIAGLMTSYYVGSSAGAAITLYLAVWFLGTFLARKKQ